MAFKEQFKELLPHSAVLCRLNLLHTLQNVKYLEIARKPGEAVITHSLSPNKTITVFETIITVIICFCPFAFHCVLYAPAASYIR